jgi:hypothetical protein
MFNQKHINEWLAASLVIPVTAFGALLSPSPSEDSDRTSSHPLSSQVQDIPKKSRLSDQTSSHPSSSQDQDTSKQPLTDSTHGMPLSNQQEGACGKNQEDKEGEQDTPKQPLPVLTHGMPLSNQLEEAYGKNEEEKREKGEEEAEKANLARNIPTTSDKPVATDDNKQSKSPVENQIIVRPQSQLANNQKLSDSLRGGQSPPETSTDENNERVKT